MRALLRGDISAVDVAYAASPVGAFREAAMVEVARRGSLEALRWLADHGGPLCGTGIMAAAARSGTLGKVVWLHRMVRAKILRKERVLWSNLRLI